MRGRLSAFSREFLQLAEDVNLIDTTLRHAKLGFSAVKIEIKVDGYLSELIQGAFIPADPQELEFKLIIFESKKSLIEIMTKDFQPFIDHNWPMPNELTYPFRVFFDRAQGMIYVYDSIRKVGAIWLDTERHLDRRSFVAPFRLMFSWMGLNIKAEVIHASAVVNQGRAYVFSGPSGSGKSTLALMLTKINSVRIVSDDAVVIQEGVVHALYSRAKISQEDRFIQIPNEKTFDLKETKNGKRILPLNTTESFIKSGALTAVVFPRVSHATKLTPISTSDAVPLFLPNSLREIFQGNSRNIINHMQIITSKPCFRLELGPSYNDNLDVFIKLDQEIQNHF
jgi:hypothetical protein